MQSEKNVFIKDLKKKNLRHLGEKSAGTGTRIQNSMVLVCLLCIHKINEVKRRD